MLTPDQVTAIAPDAASLKAGQGLATPRKWESLGGDAAALWGLAMGSGKEPYQTRVCLGDLATKCSCPSRKFPCKHAIGLMLISCTQPAELREKDAPAWVTEWLEGRSAREQKAAALSEEKAADAKPKDEKAAEKRRAQRQDRVEEGIALLQQAVLDVTREGLASSAARNAAGWENLARRMVDSQAPGLAGNLRFLTERVLRDPEVDEELPLELGRLYLLLHACQSAASLDETGRAEMQAQLGGRSDDSTFGEAVEDEWFVASRRIEERDRLLSSLTWLYGRRTRRWARLMKFAHAPQTIAEPWPLGSSVTTALTFSPGWLPQRAASDGVGTVQRDATLEPDEAGLDDLLERYAAGLAVNPFLRTLPFLIRLRPTASGRLLCDEHGRALPWKAATELALRVDCIAGGRTALMSGEWDGRALEVTSIADGGQWISLLSQHQS